MLNNKTQEKIEKAFLSLYKKQIFSSITVKEICKEANISRATFYTYYEDISSLLNEIEDTLYQDSILILKRWEYLDFRAFGKETLLSINYDIYNQIYKQKDKFQALFGSYGRQEFINRFYNMVEKVFVKKIELDRIETINVELLASFCTGAMIRAHNWWISSMSSVSVNDMALVTTEILLGILYPKGENYNVNQIKYIDNCKK